MPVLDEAELKLQIKASQFANFYLIYGEEKYLVKHYSNLLEKKIVDPAFVDFNLHIYDGKNVDLDEIAVAAEALPMMSEYACIIIKDLAVDSLNAEDSARLEEIVNDIPESTVIIISLPTLNVNMKNPKCKKLLDCFVKNGNVVEFSHFTLQKLAKLIEKGAKDRDCTFGFSEANYLISSVGDDMTVVLNELEKICAYKKSGVITKEDIDAVVVKSMQARAFDLAKALVANNCDTAMSILDTLFSMKEEPISILGAIIVPYVDMYRAKVYLSGGLRAEDASKDFNYKNKEFRLTNAARSASKYSVKQLRSFLEVLFEADNLLKSTSVDQRLVLEQTITKLLLVSNGERI